MPHGIQWSAEFSGPQRSVARSHLIATRLGGGKTDRMEGSFYACINYAFLLYSTFGFSQGFLKNKQTFFSFQVRPIFSQRAPSQE